MSPDHLVVAPVVVPFVAGALLVAWRGASLRAQSRVGAASVALLLALAAVLVLRADGGEVHAYLLGNWPPPFGIAFALDRLSALMVALVALRPMQGLVDRSALAFLRQFPDPKRHIYAGNVRVGVERLGGLSDNGVVGGATGVGHGRGGGIGEGGVGRDNSGGVQNAPREAAAAEPTGGDPPGRALRLQNDDVRDGRFVHPGADAHAYGLAVATADGHVAAVIDEHAGHAAVKKKIRDRIGHGAGHRRHGGQVIIADRLDAGDHLKRQRVRNP